MGPKPTEFGKHLAGDVLIKNEKNPTSVCFFCVNVFDIIVTQIRDTPNEGAQHHTHFSMHGKNVGLADGDHECREAHAPTAPERHRRRE